MPDFFFTEAGDITRGSDGDIALTNTPWRDDVQQVYIRAMTDIGDYVLYSNLGADLSQLYGMPQSPATGQRGVDLISSALDRENVFLGKTYTVKSVPTGLQSIRFDITVTSPSKEQIQISITQKLGVQ